MTSYEIHSFIPGTRANPREMNENFNIVLEQIDTKANNDLSNLSQTGQDYIKNCSISKNIGELVYSCIPQTDSSLHLLDGSVILSNGIYQNFVSYIANLNQSYPNLFTTESDWQDSVTQYGVCGKFVYDSVNNTVRLPKITGIVEGTTDISALGDLVEAGLPVHTHTRGTMDITGSWYAGDHGIGASGAFYVSGGANGPTGNYAWRDLVSFAASRNWTGSTSNPNYAENINNTTTVQPQTIKCFVYIVIANSSKTEIQVDIDQVATDLNGKADTDLTNATDQAKILMGGMAMPGDKYIDLTLGASGATYTAPANGWFNFHASLSNHSSGGFNLVCLINESISSLLQVNSYANASGASHCIIIPVKKDEKIRVEYFNNVLNYLGYQTPLTFIYAQGSESEAS